MELICFHYNVGGVNVNGDILGIILRKRLQLIGSTLRARTTEVRKKRNCIYLSGGFNLDRPG